jgi:hypothetical protein
MKLKIFILALLVSSQIFCQEYKFVLLDSLSKKPLAFAHIFTANNNEGLTSNATGEVILKQGYKEEAITITHLAYCTKTLKKEVYNDTIFLKQKNTNLPEVIVQNKKVQTLGYTNLKKTHYITTSGENIILAQHIPNETGAAHTLKSLHYKIRSKKKDSLLVRAHIYSVDPITKKPNKELLSKSIIYPVRRKKGTLSIDIQDQYIEMPSEGLFIGLEWLGENNDAAYGFTAGNDSSINAFVTLAKLKNKIWLQSQVSGSYLRASFGVEVY